MIRSYAVPLKKKSRAQLERESVAAIALASRTKKLDSYKRLASALKRWSQDPNRPTAVAVRKYTRRVPKGGDRGFWFGVMLDDLLREAQHTMELADVQQFEKFIDLLTAPDRKR